MSGDNRLPVLAGEITDSHERATKAGRAFAQHAVAAGRRLTEAKGMVAHGQWRKWLAANVPTLNERTAQRYMRAARTAGKSDTVSFSSLRHLVRPKKRQPFDELERVLREEAQLEAEMAALWRRLEAAENGPTTIDELQAIIAEAERIVRRSRVIRAIAAGEYARLSGEALQ